MCGSNEQQNNSERVRIYHICTSRCTRAVPPVAPLVVHDVVRTLHNMKYNMKYHYMCRAMCHAARAGQVHCAGRLRATPAAFGACCSTAGGTHQQKKSRLMHLQIDVRLVLRIATDSNNHVLQ